MSSTVKASDKPRAGGPLATAWAVADLMRLTRPHGTFLLLIPSLWALVLAGHGRPPLALVAVFVAGAFLMRSAGCAINDLADRRIDPLVERTRTRPLADGRLGAGAALFTFAVLVGVSGLLIMHLNRLTIILSAAGLGWAVLYPFTKRFVSCPQAFLGAAFGWGTFMAWAAVRDEMALTPALLFLATVCWAIAYDTLYAIQDMQDDIKVGIKSAAILFGSAAWAWVTGLLMATCALVGWAALREGAGAPFLAALAAVAGYFAYQGLRVRRGLDRPQAFALFKAHVPAGAALLAAMWLDLRGGA
ncbi:MAG: 4-hydroxybenzoate octaprenyltransferase [Nitrospirae bacterium]|nr:4-hydroxybenzoate octaprenyltransferase [Nitrospirota bacterium]